MRSTLGDLSALLLLCLMLGPAPLCAAGEREASSRQIAVMQAQAELAAEEALLAAEEADLAADEAALKARRARLLKRRAELLTKRVALLERTSNVASNGQKALPKRATYDVQPAGIEAIPDVQPVTVPEVTAVAEGPAEPSSDSANVEPAAPKCNSASKAGAGEVVDVQPVLEAEPQESAGNEEPIRDTLEQPVGRADDSAAAQPLCASHTNTASSTPASELAVKVVDQLLAWTRSATIQFGKLLDQHNKLISRSLGPPAEGDPASLAGT